MFHQNPHHCSQVDEDGDITEPMAACTTAAPKENGLHEVRLNIIVSILVILIISRIAILRHLSEQSAAWEGMQAEGGACWMWAP